MMQIPQEGPLRRLPFLLVFDPFQEAKDLCSFQDWQLRPQSLKFPLRSANSGLVLLKSGFVSVEGVPTVSISINLTGLVAPG